MSSRLTDTTSALVQAALRLTAPNQRDDHPHAGDIALEHLILAARDLVCVVDGTEPDKQPAGWSKRAPGSPGWMVSPETASYSAARPVDLLRGVLHGARHAARFAKEGRMVEASEHVDAIERLTAAYRVEVNGTEQEKSA